MLEKEIHCKLQETCYTLHSKAAICKKRKQQWLHKTEPGSTLRNRCKPKKVTKQVAKRACHKLKPACSLSHNTIATQVAKIFVPCNTSCRAQFHFLQRLQRFLKALQVEDRHSNGVFKTISSCSPTLQRVMCILELGTDFFPTLLDKLQGKLYHVTRVCRNLRPRKLRPKI